MVFGRLLKRNVSWTEPVQSRSRRVLLVTLLGVSAGIWTELSSISPAQGWLRSAIESARSKILRATATVPCTSDSVLTIEFNNLRIPYPDCWSAAHFGAVTLPKATEAWSDGTVWVFADPAATVGVGIMVSRQTPLSDLPIESMPGDRIETINGWDVIVRRDKGDFLAEIQGETTVIVVSAEVPDHLLGSRIEQALDVAFRQIVSKICAMNDSAIDVHPNVAAS